MPDADLGTLSTDGARYRLTFTRRLTQAPEVVWRAVTEPEYLAAWFPQAIVGDRAARAPLRFEGAQGESFEGQMLAFEPPRSMELRWGTDLLRFELRPDGPGTLLVLTDALDELGKAARDGAGWHECLDRLTRQLDGEPQPEWGNEWAGLNDRYVADLGPQASTIGPPPSDTERTARPT